MAKQSRRNFLKMAGAVAVATVSGSAVAETAFGFKKMDAGYQQVAMEGKCGEGKCGGSMKKESAKKMEGKCGGSMKGSGKMEGKCGGSMKGSGKMEGKCGGSMKKESSKKMEGKCGGMNK